MSAHLSVRRPRNVPPALQTKTSRIQWSHQHSLKFGSWCSRVYSMNSNVTEITVVSHQSRNICNKVVVLVTQGEEEWCSSRGRVITHQGFAKVSSGVCYDENVHFIFEVVVGVRRILMVVDAAVATVILLRNRLTKARIQVLQQFPGISRFLSGPKFVFRTLLKKTVCRSSSGKSKRSHDILVIHNQKWLKFGLLSIFSEYIFGQVCKVSASLNQWFK